MSGGGGGTSNPDTRYANLDNLYGVQSQASQYMLDQAMPRVPVAMQNSERMVNDAMSGALADQMRSRAGYDANQAIASSNNDAIRKLTSYGVGGDPSSGKFADMISQNAFSSAKTRAGAATDANKWAEDQKWNRNANFYGQVMGMNSGAMSGLSLAGAGLSNTTNQMNANDKQNAVGYGQAGSAFASGLFKARGGYIEGESRRAQDEQPARIAVGGDAWSAYKSANPVQTTSYSSGKRANPYMAMLSGAAPQVLGAGLKDIFKGDKSKIIEWGKQGANYIKGIGASDTASNSGLAFETNPDVVAGNVDAAGNVIGNGASSAEGVGAADDVVGNAGTAVDAAGNVGAGVDVANTATTYAAPVADTMSGVETVEYLAARGGHIKKKPGLCMALGGMAKSTVSSSDKLDSDTVSSMDASNSLSISKMDDGKVGVKNSLETHAKPVVDTSYSGKTDGQGGGSDGDPDGFGKYNGDYRGVFGKAALNYIPIVGQILGPINSALGNPIHEVMEPSTRDRQVVGDNVAGATGAMALSPVGTPLSGKYSSEEIVKATIGPSLGAPFISSFLANGGEANGSGLGVARKDFTPGGDVDGPGTETSDSIPAQLSDGEIVENADAVDVAGKDVLLKINNEGLKVRDGKKSKAEAQKYVGLAMIKRGKQLAKKGD